MALPTPAQVPGRLPAGRLPGRPRGNRPIRFPHPRHHHRLHPRPKPRDRLYRRPPRRRRPPRPRAARSMWCGLRHPATCHAAGLTSVRLRASAIAAVGPR
jgi:hypothetical protein